MDTPLLCPQMKQLHSSSHLKDKCLPRFHSPDILVSPGSGTYGIDLKTTNVRETLPLDHDSLPSSSLHTYLEKVYTFGLTVPLVDIVKNTRTICTTRFHSGRPGLGQSVLSPTESTYVHLTADPTSTFVAVVAPQSDHPYTRFRLYGVVV